MNTREQAVALCKIAPVVNKIGQDEEFNAKLAAMAEENKKSKGKTVFQTATAMIDVFAPLMLDRHYDDVMMIVGVLLGKEMEELESMGILTIIREVKGVLNEELIGFFKQSAGTDTNA